MCEIVNSKNLGLHPNHVIIWLICNLILCSRTNLGQNVIFQLVEKVREVLHFNFQGSAWSELESWPESEEINTVEPEKMRPNNAEYECPDILHGGVIMERKSSFQGHAAIVHSVKQVEYVTIDY